MATLHELITKVIPLKGILRTPSYWMRKVLMAIVDAVEAVQTELRNADSKLQSNLTIQEDMFSKSIFYAKSGQPFFVLGENTKAVVDGTLMVIEAYKVYKANTLSFDDYRINVPSHLSIKISVGISGIIFANDDFTSLDLSNFDTSKVTSMDSMFSGCSGLTSLDLSNFDTSKVTYMNGMFSSCSSLTSLNLSSFDTSAVTNIMYMFNRCSGLTSLDLSSFNTSAVTNMNGMFSSCSSLTSLNLSSFDTSAVTNMSLMFSGCSSLTTLDLSNFNTSTVTDMQGMFSGCSSLTTLDLSNFNTSAVTNMNLVEQMFQNCTALRNIKCKQAFKDWCVANASIIKLTVANITWEIVE